MSDPRALEAQPRDLLEQTFRQFIERELGGGSVMQEHIIEQMRLAFFAGASTVNAMMADAIVADAKAQAARPPNLRSKTAVLREVRDVGRRLHYELDQFVKQRLNR